MSDALSIIAAALSILEIAERATINLAALQALRDRAKAEGREISEDELAGLAQEAQAAIDHARTV